jgi:hypothetical protein
MASRARARERASEWFDKRENRFSFEKLCKLASDPRAIDVFINIHAEIDHHDIYVEKMHAVNCRGNI